MKTLNIKFRKPSFEFLPLKKTLKDDKDLENFYIDIADLESFRFPLVRFSSNVGGKDVLCITDEDGKILKFAEYGKDNKYPDLKLFFDDDGMVYQIMMHRFFSSRQDFFRRCEKPEKISIVVNTESLKKAFA